MVKFTVSRKNSFPGVFTIWGCLSSQSSSSHSGRCHNLLDPNREMLKVRNTLEVKLSSCYAAVNPSYWFSGSLPAQKHVCLSHVWHTWSYCRVSTFMEGDDFKSEQWDYELMKVGTSSQILPLLAVHVKHFSSLEHESAGRLEDLSWWQVHFTVTWYMDCYLAAAAAYNILMMSLWQASWLGSHDFSHVRLHYDVTGVP